MGGTLNKKAFTMIELLCVMVIIGSMGVSTMGSFLDFRNEARAAATRQALSAIRTGFKLQKQQFTIKCSWSPWLTDRDKTVLLGSSLAENDVTSSTRIMYVGWPSIPVNVNMPVFSEGDDPPGVSCTTAQIPNPAERRFVNSVSLPLNPFASSEFPRVGGSGVNGSGQQTTGVNLIGYINSASSYASKCAMIDDVNNYQPFTRRSGGVDTTTYSRTVSHWILIGDTEEIIAGTHTPGINECNF